MEDDNGKVNGPSMKRLRKYNDDKENNWSNKRSKKPQKLEFVGWGSTNLIEFLQSLGRDTTNKIPKIDVVRTVMKYIRDDRELELEKHSRETLVCDEKLRLLFESEMINITEVPGLVEKHYVENQDNEFDVWFRSVDDDDEQLRLDLTNKVDDEQKKVVVKKPKGTIAAIVSANIKLLYLKKSLVQELAKTPKTFTWKIRFFFYTAT